MEGIGSPAPGAGWETVVMRMTVAELRIDLKRRQLETAGIKAVLQQRLLAYLKAEWPNDDSDSDSDVSDVDVVLFSDSDVGGAKTIIMPVKGQAHVAVATVAGSGALSYHGGGHADGPSATAEFNNPSSLAVLPDGRVLVFEHSGAHLRMLSADLQHVSTVAGTGDVGFRDGPAAKARFNNPISMAVLPDGRVLVADLNNRRIRMLRADLQVVTTVAGDGAEGHRDGVAAQARFGRPSGVGVLSDGRVVITEMEQRVRVLSADLQTVSSVAMTHAAAPFNTTRWQWEPYTLAVLNDRVVTVALNGVVTVLASTEPGHARCGELRVALGALHERGHVETGSYADGDAVQARFGECVGVAALPDGRLVITGGKDNSVRIISADLQTVRTVVAGNWDDELDCTDSDIDEPTVLFDCYRDGAAAHARLLKPIGAAVLPCGRVLVAEAGNHRIRVITGLTGPMGAKPAPKPSKRMRTVLATAGTCISGGGGGDGSDYVPLAGKRRRRISATVPAKPASGFVLMHSTSDASGNLSIGNDSEQPGDMAAAAEAEPLV